MKQNKVALAMSALAMFIASGAATAGDADFTMVNKTGYTIREIYISPAHKSSWGSDRMGEGTLDNNKSRLFKFSDKASCNQDIKMVFDPSDVEIVVEDIDLCSIEKFSVSYNATSKKVLWKAE